MKIRYITCWFDNFEVFHFDNFDVFHIYIYIYIDSKNDLNIGALVGLSEVQAIDRGYVFKNNPEVNPLVGDIGKKLKLQLAINTAQYGRTFQDRSARITLKEETFASGKIHEIFGRNFREFCELANF